MEHILRNSILQTIGKVYEQAENSKLNPEFFNSIEQELEILSHYFDVSHSQALFTAIIFTLNYKNNSVTLSDLFEYFDCNPIKLLEYSDDFDRLEIKGFVEKKKARRQRFSSESSESFLIATKLSKAILKNEEVPELENKSEIDVFVILEKLYDLAQERSNEEIGTYNLLDNVKELITGNLHIPLINRIYQLSLPEVPNYIYLYVIWKTIVGRESLNISSILDEVFENKSAQITYTQKFLSERNPLIKENLIEIEESHFYNDSLVKLSPLSFQILEECDIKIILNKKKRNNIINPSDITKKPLYFDKNEMEQLYVLKDLLDEEKFKLTQTRLEEKGHSKGITALLHGVPGTGKTEFVMQIAKFTNREVMKVEISQSKSMWYGESEKLIKRIFSDYKSYAKDCELTPILLFNEADALISKRKDIGNSNTSQTENAIQNIILEEIENFDGILIATTNLVKNLDSAFERRFLFKIPFYKPSKESRAKIWKHKLSHLDEKDCEILAEKYSFSGGQIDNIVRKSEIQEVIYGKITNFEDVVSFCEEESLTVKKSTIGFTPGQT